MAKKEKITFQQVLDALLDENTPLNPRYPYRFSDLSASDLAALEGVWPRVPVWRRQALMEDIEDLGESDMLLSFEALGRFALKDSDARVRQLAIRTLWDYDASDLIPVLINMMENDSDTEVRAAAASALGRFIYLGELEEIPENALHHVEDRLLQTCQGSADTLVRRRALEALGFSGRAEVVKLIENAYASGDTDWMASALFAMGRSANEDWTPMVQDMLESLHPAIRLEAARAAGELEISASVPRLVELLNDSDDDVRLASIWSLSQVGGEGVREILQKMYEETEDDSEAELLESALDNLSFTEDLQLYSILDLPDLDGSEGAVDEDLDDEIDDYLDEDDEDLED
jgi:HEAT repeat protein